jgi:hypothetical protein
VITTPVCAAWPRLGWLVRTRVIPVIDTEDALDASDDPADCAADHRSDRTGYSISFVKSVRGTARYPLCLGRERKTER